VSPISTFLARLGFLTVFAVEVVCGIVVLAGLGSFQIDPFDGAAQAAAPTGAVPTAREIIGPSPVVPFAGRAGGRQP
jgi:hypothetical protein